MTLDKITKLKLLRLRRQMPDAEILRRTFASRVAALRASVAGRDLENGIRAFKSASASYQAETDGTGKLDGLTNASFSGLTWWVPDDENGGFSERILEGRLPLGEILASRELAVGHTMLDIGANIGTTSIPRIVLGDFQVAYGAEPEARNYSALVRNVRENGLEGLVLPDRVAISDHNGFADMTISPGMGKHVLRAEAGKNTVSVPCRTLDSWIDDLHIDPNLIAFVKCDVQGWEPKVLDGATELLRYKHIAWQLEIWPKGLAKAGTHVDEMVERINTYFEWFIDLKYLHGKEHTQKVSELSRVIAELGKGDGHESGQRNTSFTNILVYNGQA